MLNRGPATIRGPLIRIRESLDELKGTDRRVAEAILRQPEKIPYLSITQLARLSDVSEAAVVRFCQRHGYGGYQDFRVALAQDVVDHVHTVLEDISNDDDLPTIVRKVTQANIQAIQSTSRIIDYNELERAVTAVLSARRVSLHAVGASYGVAWDAFQKLTRIGLTAILVSDVHAQVSMAAQLGPEDLCFGISHRGKSFVVVESLRLARQRGATTMCLTRYTRSPLVDVSDIRLFAAFEGGVLAQRGRVSRTAMLLLLDVLFVAITARAGAAAASALQRSREAIDRLKEMGP